MLNLSASLISPVVLTEVTARIVFVIIVLGKEVLLRLSARTVRESVKFLLGLAETARYTVKSVSQGIRKVAGHFNRSLSVIPERGDFLNSAVSARRRIEKTAGLVAEGRNRGSAVEKDATKDHSFN
jgi:hypothetical protein